MTGEPVLSIAMKVLEAPMTTLAVAGETTTEGGGGGGGVEPPPQAIKVEARRPANTIPRKFFIDLPLRSITSSLFAGRKF
jgi:hypothetical protein